MFESGKKYWFNVKRERFEPMSILGRVIEENNFFIKIVIEATEKYPEKEMIISLSQITGVNEYKER